MLSDAVSLNTAHDMSLDMTRAVIVIGSGAPGLTLIVKLDTPLVTVGSVVLNVTKPPPLDDSKTVPLKLQLNVAVTEVFPHNKVDGLNETVSENTLNEHKSKKIKIGNVLFIDFDLLLNNISHIRFVHTAMGLTKKYET